MSQSTDCRDAIEIRWFWCDWAFTQFLSHYHLFQTGIATYSSLLFHFQHTSSWFYIWVSCLQYKFIISTLHLLAGVERSRLIKSRSWSTSCVLMFSVTYSLSLTPLSPSDLLCSSLKHPLHLHISIRVMVRLLCVIRVENNINNNNKNNSSLWSREERRKKVFDNVHQRETVKYGVFLLRAC